MCTVCTGVSVHEHGSRSGLRHLRLPEDPPGNLDRPVSGRAADSGQATVWSWQEHPAPVGGEEGGSSFGQ